MPKLFPLPMKRGDRRTLVPQFLAKGADQVPATWSQAEAVQHAEKRLATIVPTLSFAAWLKRVDAVSAETVRVKGAVLQDQFGTSDHPALHLAWGTPWLNQSPIWDRANSTLGRIGLRGDRVGRAIAKVCAQTEIAPWGANYGDSLMEGAGKYSIDRVQSTIRTAFAEALRITIRDQKTGHPIDQELIRHGLELMQVAIHQATDVASERLAERDLLAFYEFVTSHEIAPRAIEQETGREVDFLEVLQEEPPWVPLGFRKRSAFHDYSDENVELHRELHLPAEFIEQAKLTVEVTESANLHPPGNMASGEIQLMEKKLDQLAAK